EDGIRDWSVTGVQTCALPILLSGGKIETLDELGSILTLAIFTASAQHAAVNFPQLPIMSFAPAFPLAAYRGAPTSKSMEHDDLRSEERRVGKEGRARA